MVGGLGPAGQIDGEQEDEEKKRGPEPPRTLLGPTGRVVSLVVGTLFRLAPVVLDIVRQSSFAYRMRIGREIT